MDINNLIQTLVFMNIKDISNMSYRELFPIILFCLIHSYKECILTFIQPYTKWNSYKSQIVNEITYGLDKDGYMRSNYTVTISPILWNYIRNVKAVKSCNILKEYRFNLKVERGKDGTYYSDTFLPDINTTVELGTDVYLEFIHSSKTIKTEKDTEKNESILKLILKSKSMDYLHLKKWLDEVKIDYNNWIKEDQSLRLYISYTTIAPKNALFNPYNLSSTKTFNNLFFEQKEIIINRLKQYSDIDRYKRLGIPHTLGFLFYGEPGCGKTSCIKAMANYLQRNIISINLKHVNDIKELIELFLSIYIPGGYHCEKSKRIYVFEEIDCCVDEKDNPFLDRTLKIKENKEEDKLDKLATALLKDEKTDLKTPPKITTGEVLELLDGICETDDRIIIFTTNHPEKIDKAFMRPGRIDLCIEFKKLRRIDINNLYKLWFGKDIGEKALNKIKDYSLSQAEFGKLCFENNAEKVLEKLVNGV